jgi:hypothetical protein
MLDGIGGRWHPTPPAFHYGDLYEVAMLDLNKMIERYLAAAKTMDEHIRETQRSAGRREPHRPTNPRASGFSNDAGGDATEISREPSFGGGNTQKF